MKQSKQSPLPDPRAKAMQRIGKQVHLLVVPDFRPLARVLRNLMDSTRQERNSISVESEKIRAEATAAATRLMLLDQKNQPEQEQNYFRRITYQSGEGL